MMKKLIPFLVFVLVLGYFLTGCAPKWIIDNPYKNVDWENNIQYKANLHTHTTRSDGSLSPQKVVDSYSELGYKILAITDHNQITFPWDSFSVLSPSERALERLENGEIDSSAIIYENRDAHILEMYPVEGNEVTSPHHLGSFFNDYMEKLNGEYKTIEDIGAKNGLVLLNHPGRYTAQDPGIYNVDWYVDIFNHFDYLTGMEVYNQGDRYPTDRALWDSILVRTMPDRPIWGYSNDDFHSGMEKLGRNWNVFILTELTEESIRQGMLNGSFFYVYAVDGHRGPKPPVIESINVDSKKGIIEINATGQDSIRWVSGTNVIHWGNRIRLSEVSGLKGYVRAEIFGQGSVTGTQPFGVISED